MRASFSERVERGRVHSTVGLPPTSRGDNYGAFRLRTNAGAELRIIMSPAFEEISWEHVSVSVKTRCPTWEEMVWVKSLFWADDEVVIQYHPALSEYVNEHPFCLHLWKPVNVILPTPPMRCV